MSKTLLHLGNSPELLKAMKFIAASPEAGRDEQNTCLLAQHRSVLRAAFRRALSEDEPSESGPNLDRAVLATAGPR